MEDNRVIIVGSVKLKKKIYKRNEPFSSAPGYHAIEQDAETKAEVLLEETFSNKRNEEVFVKQAEGKAPSTVYTVASPHPLLHAEEEPEELEVPVPVAAEETMQEKKSKKKKPAKERKKKKEKTQKTSEEKPQNRIAINAKGKKDKNAVKEKFQSSKRVRKFSMFEVVPAKESIEEKILAEINKDGYYNVIEPVAGSAGKKIKIKKDRKQVLILGVLLGIAVLSLFLLILTIGGLFE